MINFTLDEPDTQRCFNGRLGNMEYYDGYKHVNRTMQKVVKTMYPSKVYIADQFSSVESIESVLVQV